MTQEYLGWHFLAQCNQLRDGSPASPAGGVERYDGDPVLCAHGLHASARAIDALAYAPGSYVRRVRLEADEIASDKAVGRVRHIVASGDVSDVIIAFARICADRAKQAAEAAAATGAAAEAAGAAAEAAETSALNAILTEMIEQSLNI